MSNAKATFALPPAALAMPVSAADLDALCVYDATHADGRPWRWPGVSRVSGRSVFRARASEATPWGPNAQLDVGLDPTEAGAARLLVRYLKWRYGDAWLPPAPGTRRPPVVDAFDDHLGTEARASWVGRIWQNGRPVLIFANPSAEAGFATRKAALSVAQQLVRERMPDDWRTWLGRARRPWVEPLPAGRLDAAPACPAG